jgi:hypothetical membrane protein
MNKKLLLKLKDEKGFMGLTHSLSAIAFFLLLVAFFPNFVFNTILKSNNIIVLIGATIVIAGAALLPDFDNVKSTAISTLGPFGKIISKLTRASAVGIYTLTKTNRDNDKPDAHRGFWHTIVASIVVGVIVYFLSSIKTDVKDSFLGEGVVRIYPFAIAWLIICYQLAMASLFADSFKKLKRDLFGYVFIFGSSIVFVIIILAFSPSDIAYSWIAILTSLGYLFHILGDTLTVSGTPALWPIAHKGKRWWTYRLGGIHAGSSFEYKVVVPIFTMIIIFAIVKIILNYN